MSAGSPKSFRTDSTSPGYSTVPTSDDLSDSHAGSSTVRAPSLARYPSHRRANSLRLANKDLYSPTVPYTPSSSAYVFAEEDEEWDEDDEDDPDRFFNLEFLSHIAVKVRDTVPRAHHVKGRIGYSDAFTGRDVVSTIQSLIHPEMLALHGTPANDRRVALAIARSLLSQLWFCDVEWAGGQLTDDVHTLYIFEDAEGSSGVSNSQELPTGIMTVLTKCYATTCEEGQPCYSLYCPFQGTSTTADTRIPEEGYIPEPTPKEDWVESVDHGVLASLPDSEIRRQDLIHEIINEEEQFVLEMDMIEQMFIKGLGASDPPIIPPDAFEEFMEEVFGNLLDVRHCNKRLVEALAVRKREQAPIIQWVGDVFVSAAEEFSSAYPVYVSHLPDAEKRLVEEIRGNPRFKDFLLELQPTSLQQLLHQPEKRLAHYPAVLARVLAETDKASPDVESLQEAISAMRRLSTVARLRTVQAKGSLIGGYVSWHDLVSPEELAVLSKEEIKRQSVIFELIQTEAEYVRDLELVGSLFIRPLCTIVPAIISRDRTSEFIQAVFYNINELLEYHRALLDALHERQREEHPVIRSVSEPMLDAALNWRDAYMEYISHYPIAVFNLEEELSRNSLFCTFVDDCVAHPDARRVDIKTFINRPIPRLLKYGLILKAILRETPAGHPDHENMPQVVELLQDLARSAEKGQLAARRRVEMWRFSTDLVFSPGETVDLQLAEETRTIVHTGKLHLDPRNGGEFRGWKEVFVILFDNYLVITTVKEAGATKKFHVQQRPLLLDLLSLGDFDAAPQRFARPRGSVLSPGGGGTGTLEMDARSLYPCTLYNKARPDWRYTLFAESATVRKTWGDKLREALGLRAVVQESDKAFELEAVLAAKFFVPTTTTPGITPASGDLPFASRISCSVPFSLPDGRTLVAIGCSDGVWIGLRHETRSLRRVLHVKNVTQCALLSDFGTFLVLADKELWAYDIESMVPSTPQSPTLARSREKLNAKREVMWFKTGHLGDRSLVVFMTKKLLDSVSVFHVLEPLSSSTAGSTSGSSRSGSIRGLRTSLMPQKQEWFRVYAEFGLSAEGYDVCFVNGIMSVLSSKGFGIMDLRGYEEVKIPVLQPNDPTALAISKRLETSRPLGMFRTSAAEFLLCYADFGVYVDRHGHLSRPGADPFFEWEGAAERVACHPPHVLLFTPRFVEVRELDTARLVQIVEGRDVACLWDDAASAGKARVEPAEWSPEARVHVVMRADQPGGELLQRGYVMQLYELVPTLPYVSDSLSPAP